MLPTKLQTAQPPRAQAIPQANLGIGCRRAQLPRTLPSKRLGAAGGGAAGGWLLTPAFAACGDAKFADVMEEEDSDAEGASEGGALDSVAWRDPATLLASVSMDAALRAVLLA